MPSLFGCEWKLAAVLESQKKIQLPLFIQPSETECFPDQASICGEASFELRVETSNATFHLKTPLHSSVPTQRAHGAKG